MIIHENQRKRVRKLLPKQGPGHLLRHQPSKRYSLSLVTLDRNEDHKPYEITFTPKLHPWFCSHTAKKPFTNVSLAVSFVTLKV